MSLSYPPEQVTERGVDNLSNLIELGFDVHILAPAPDTARLMAASFRRFTNWRRSTELAPFSAVPRLVSNTKFLLSFGVKILAFSLVT